MPLSLTIYFDGQFWTGILEDHTDTGIRAVKHTFGPEPTDAQLHEFLLAHGNALLDRLTKAPVIPTGQRAARPAGNPKRAARQAAREARLPRPSTASQLALKADQESRAQDTSASARAIRERDADELRAKRRAKAKAKHRGH